MSIAKALKFDPNEPRPNLAAPMGETPVARPGFARAMTFLVVLSVPLWAAIIGGGYLVARALN